ncbi:aromatic acid exporter family protein [Halobacillus amylolyticus]|uniref:aromatic acid exporter family protein n=1 Tax=Halobacillus amylolyticus TaxID=2932259 RepID=UPI0037C09087
MLFKLDDRILVATITATAMIPDFQDDYFVSFITRLGTTSIGIVISTFVNFSYCRLIILRVFTNALTNCSSMPHN